MAIYKLGAVVRITSEKSTVRVHDAAYAGAVIAIGSHPYKCDVKTNKSVEIARAMIDPGHGGVTVSTLKEAEVMAGAGIRDHWAISSMVR